MSTASLPFKIKKVSDALANGLKVILYGPSGFGKTTMCGSLPGKTLILNAENGTLVLKDLDNADDIDVVDVKTIEDIQAIYIALLNKTIVYDNIVLDSLTEIGETMFANLNATMDEKSKEFGGLYVEFKAKMIEMIKAFRDLKGMNVVLIALADMVDVNGMIKMMPALPHKKTQAAIMALFDECLYGSYDDNGTRILYTSDSNMHMAKSRMRIPNGGSELDFKVLYPDLSRVAIEALKQKQ